jgi:deoxyribonuclease V
VLGETPGSRAEIIDRSEVVGLAVRTRRNSKPVYVTVGQRVDLPSAARIILACGRGYRLPEPTRHAHNLAAKLKGDLS